MKLQLALDGDLQSSIAVLDATKTYIDIAEIGTPLIYREGVWAVRELRRPNRQGRSPVHARRLEAGQGGT